MKDVLLGMFENHVWLIFFWVLYCLLHSLLANAGLKRAFRKNFEKSYRWYRPAYVVFAFVTLIALVIYQVQLPSDWLFERRDWTNLTGALMAFAGIVIMGICIKKYFLSLSGLKALMQEHTGAELMITGIHRWVRHPLYLGTFAFIWGGFLFYPKTSIFLSNSIITVYTLIGIILEEQKLIGEFGEAYRAYRREVPMLLPFKRPSTLRS